MTECAKCEPEEYSAGNGCIACTDAAQCPCLGGNVCYLDSYCYNTGNIDKYSIKVFILFDFENIIKNKGIIGNKNFLFFYQVLKNLSYINNICFTRFRRLWVHFLWTRTDREWIHMYWCKWGVYQQLIETHDWLFSAFIVTILKQIHIFALHHLPVFIF